MDYIISIFSGLWTTPHDTIENTIENTIGNTIDKDAIDKDAIDKDAVNRDSIAEPMDDPIEDPIEYQIASYCIRSKYCGIRCSDEFTPESLLNKRIIFVGFGSAEQAEYLKSKVLSDSIYEKYIVKVISCNSPSASSPLRYSSSSLFSSSPPSDMSLISDSTDISDIKDSIHGRYYISITGETDKLANIIYFINLPYITIWNFTCKNPI
jgi:hypothetical protein